MNIDLESRKCTLRDASKEDNEDNYLLNDGEEEVYSFDDISQDVGDELRNRKKLKSVDALVITNQEKIYFIEFKNTRHAHMPKNELYPKAHDSVCTYLLAIEPNISINELKEKAYYVVVYKDNKESRGAESKSVAIEDIKGKFRQYSKKENSLDRVLWDLDKYEGVLFKKVYTVDKEVFIEKLKPEIWKSA